MFARTNQAAVIRAWSPNIGDDVQTYAALQHAGFDAKILNRDGLGRVWKFSGVYRTIMNGWYMYDPRSWPPSRSVDPLFVALHLSKRIAKLNKSGLSPKDVLLKGESLDYFRHHVARGGVGVRDLATLEHFQEAGVDAYFSGCLTMTIRPQGVARRPGVALAVDLNPAALAAAKAARPDIVPVTHKIPRLMSMRKRLKLVNELMRAYEEAELVVTPRLHTALPCLALGTPVLFVHHDMADPRFGGLIDHVHSATRDDFIAGRYDYDLKAPPPNAEGWKPMAAKLAARVGTFLKAGET